MALIREDSSGKTPKPRVKHKCIPIKGEFGRYFVPSASAAKDGKDEGYYVDVLAVEDTNYGPVTGTCPCKGWSVRKTCSHVRDATDEHWKLISAGKAAELGLPDLTAPQC